LLDASRKSSRLFVSPRELPTGLRSLAERQWGGKDAGERLDPASKAQRFLGLCPVRQSRCIGSTSMNKASKSSAPKPARRFARNTAADHPAEPATMGAGASPEAKDNDHGKTGPGPRVTKAEIVIALLLRPEGATIAQMCGATGWQQHSVRGFLAGTVRKLPDLTLTSDKIDDTRVYRVSATTETSS
jgi:hypothetical protein